MLVNFDPIRINEMNKEYIPNKKTCQTYFSLARS